MHQFKFEDPKWFNASLDITGLGLEKNVTVPNSNQPLPDWSIELLRRVNSYTDDTDIRNQWKMALQTYPGSDHTILTNLVKGEGQLDQKIIHYLKSIQGDFPPKLKKYVDDFLRSIAK